MRSIDGVVVRFSVWDDWELLEEYDTSNVKQAAYLQGAHGVVKSLVNNVYYYQDKLGSTTHVADGSGTLLESYRYDLYGTPSYFDSTSQPINSSTVGVTDLYAGERWVSELHLYDLRNRFMSPELGRFLQTDPVGFKGDGSNLYRYCHNDPEDFSDPMGLIENPAGGWEALNGGKPPSYQMEDYHNSLIPSGLPAGIQRDIALFEKRMNAGNGNVKWTYGINETWSSSASFKNKTAVDVTAWSILSTALVEGGKIVGFRNELLVHIHHNMSASAAALKFARRDPNGEAEHFRDALRAASSANGYGNRHFDSARDIAARSARALIGTNMPASTAKAQRRPMGVSPQD